jgi:hypothetical protein
MPKSGRHFLENMMQNKKLERRFESIKTHPTLVSDSLDSRAGNRRQVTLLQSDTGSDVTAP